MDNVPASVPPVPPAAPTAPSTPPATPPSTMLCPQCHFVVPVDAYFCPNCGKSLREPPLSTSLGTQLWIYGFSIVLPIICFLAVSYWPGVKYIKSNDPQAKQIGVIAAVLMAISTIITFWWGIVWIQQTIQSQVNSVNTLGL